MSVRARRRRAVVLLSLAMACGGLAAARVRSSVREVESQVGSPVPVVVARKDMKANTKLEGDAARRLLSVRRVPERFVPPDSLLSRDDAVGLRTSVPVAAGSYLTAGQLESGTARGGGGPPLATGERLVEVVAAGGGGLESLGPGARVDVLITTESGSGPGRTYLALESVEILGARPSDVALDGGGDGGERAAGGTRATLRVTLRQAVLLTAAQNFAREIRLLARAPEDRRRSGQTSVDAGRL